jgi:hypothetical protein
MIIIIMGGTGGGAAPNQIRPGLMTRPQTSDELTCILIFFAKIC